MDRKQQIENWSKYYNRSITAQEYSEICQNLAGFFNVLKEWADREEKKGNDGDGGINGKLLKK